MIYLYAITECPDPPDALGLRGAPLRTVGDADAFVVASEHDGLRIETFVHTLPAASSAPLRFERRQIVALCQTPLSLAEITAVLGMPLGVVRVLVADLAEEHLVELDEPSETSVQLIERIRDLVRAL